MNVKLSTVLLSLLLPLVLGDCKCGRPVARTRIIDGEITSEGQYPWMVYLKTFIFLSDRQVYHAQCGASIINSEWVLTAGHCVSDNDSSLLPYGVRVPFGVSVIKVERFVAIGMRDISSITFETLFDMFDDSPRENLPRGVYHVDKVVIHDQYQVTQNDIALLHVNQPFTFSPLVGPVCLETKVEHYNRVEVAGWGSTSTGGRGSNRLLHVVTHEVPYYKCSERFAVRPDRQMCIQIGDKGTCHGDSGGPFVVNKNGTYYQVGLVSYGGSNVCEDPNYHDVATRISFYSKWIKSKANSGNWCSA